MKAMLGVALVSSFFLTSCNEKAPQIDFGTNKNSDGDTTYVGSPEAPQLRNVLIEEFTGVSCPPCPGGHETVKSIRDQHPNRVIVIAHHIFNFPQASPIENLSKYDFRTQDATDIGTLLGGVNAMPLAAIDRKPNNNSYLMGKSFWSLSSQNDAAVPTPVNLYLSSTFDVTTREFVAKVKVAYTKTVSTKQNISLVLIEDGIIDAQKNGLSIDTFYIHNYVLRDYITPTDGSRILDSISKKDYGRHFERTYKYTVNQAWKSENCKLVLFIANNDGDDREIVHAVQTKLL